MKITDILSIGAINNKTPNLDKQSIEEMFEVGMEENDEVVEEKEEVNENDFLLIDIERPIEEREENNEEKEDNRDNDKKEIEADNLNILGVDNKVITKKENVKVRETSGLEITFKKNENEMIRNKELKEIIAFKKVMNMIVKELRSDGQKEVEHKDLKITRTNDGKSEFKVEIFKNENKTIVSFETKDVKVLKDKIEESSNLKSDMENGEKEISKTNNSVSGTKDAKIDLITAKEKMMDMINEMTNGKSEVKVKNKEIQITLNIGENNRMTIKTTEQDGVLKVEINTDVKLDNQTKKDLQEMVIDIGEEKEIKIEIDIDDENSDKEEERNEEQKEKKKKRVLAKDGEFEKMMGGDEKHE